MFGHKLWRARCQSCMDFLPELLKLCSKETLASIVILLQMPVVDRGGEVKKPKISMAAYDGYFCKSKGNSTIALRPSPDTLLDVKLAANFPNILL